MSTPNLRFLPGQNYDCIQCGRGCTNPWNITVERSVVDALQGSEILRRVEALYGSAFQYDEGRQTFLLNRKPGGHCVFLQDSPDSPGCLNCSIHAELGYDAKPSTCKNFPIIVVESPDDIRVGASFYCRAIQQNLGRPLSAQGQSVTDYLPGQRMQTGYKPLQVFQDVFLDWEGYKVLLEFIEHPQPPAPRQTVWARALLGLSRSVIKAPSSAPIDPWALMDELVHSNNELEKAEWFTEQMHSCLNGITIFIECDSPEQTQILAQSLFSNQEVSLPACGWRGHSSELLTFRDTPLPPELQKTVERYLDATLFRHYLATRGPVLHSLIALSLIPALIRQYARLVASAAGERVSEASVLAAIDRCEHDLMLHGKGFERLWEAFANALLAQISTSM